MIPRYLLSYILHVLLTELTLITQQPQYDIFDSSPQRPLNIYGGALVNDSVDALVNQDGIVNSSKKREFPPSSPTRSPDKNEEHGSKRHRAVNWPFSGDDSPKNTASTSKRHVSTPGRSSRFQEASMHDRPSNRPPSVFVRHFNQHLNASVDHLMDRYYETEKPLPDRPDAKTLPRRLALGSPSKSPQRGLPDTHHANVSTWSHSTGAEQADAAATTKASGFFRFGKSMASAFNPVSIWQKVTTTFRDTKEEMIQEKLNERYGDRQAKAEQAYAELKQAGKLGAQGTRAIPNNVKIFAPGFSSQKEPESQRDSGISMDDESRSSMDTNKTSNLLTPAMDYSRKGSWHSRTPSFQNLKKIASMGNLHKRSTSGQSLSPEKELSDGFSNLRRSSSKVDIKKQHKLSKRVSDLESKLNAARRELDSALAPPGSVSSRSVTPIHPLPELPHEESGDEGPWKRRYTPGLPTLLSERLLTTDGMPEDGPSPVRPHSGSSHVDSLTAIETEVSESPIRGITDGRFYMQRNEQLQPTFTFSSPIKSGNAEPEAMDLVQERPMTPKEPTSFLADPSSSPQKPETLEKPTPRKRVVIKRKNVDTTYSPQREESEEDEEEDEKPKTLKKKRALEADNSPKAKKPKASRVPLSTSPTSKKPKVLTKPPPPPKVPAHVVEEISQPRGSLETVHEHEEITTTTTVTLKDAPSRPTARATPAHPSRARFDRSRSRSRSPRKTFGATTPSNPSRDHRSMSPPPSSNVGTFAAEDDIPITAKPNGRDVPPMPVLNVEGARLEKKESFEWPDDVF
jgi:hypothetical protein